MTTEQNLFDEAYKDKVVLVTGHSGFKGSWLTLWLQELGAKVIGFSLEDGSENGVFQLAKLKEKIVHINGDVRSLSTLKSVFDLYNPDFVFHLAAQPIVRESYDDPVTTFETNILGTVNVLECIKFSKSVKAAVIITTDKCYKNKEFVHGYRETDELGGSDPYSASKSCAELVINSYIQSFLNKMGKNVASVRAGNVIGGGDWSKDRIIPDIIRALSQNKPIEVRNPDSIRPWQHVLDPLYGYLLLGSKLYYNNDYSGGWNFGPQISSVVTVKEVVEKMIEKWGSGNWCCAPNYNNIKKEAGLLNLDSSKANLILKWKPKLNIDMAFKLTVDWYKNYELDDVYDLCKKQIGIFTAIKNEL